MSFQLIGEDMILHDILPVMLCPMATVASRLQEVESQQVVKEELRDKKEALPYRVCNTILLMGTYQACLA